MLVPLVGTLTFFTIVGYVLSLSLHPHIRCRRCDGGKSRGSTSGYQLRNCRPCSGTGRKPRLGTRFLGI
jgi:DnaJ-class molecular chaperone